MGMNLDDFWVPLKQSGSPKHLFELADYIFDQVYLDSFIFIRTILSRVSVK